jgi:hypothetical protein
MRENAPPARPTLADRQVPASSSTEHGHLSPPFQSSEVEVSKACALPADVIGFGDGVAPAAADLVEPAPFDVFKIAPNGEPVLVEGASSLDAAVARVASLGECFPDEYVIASQATGRRILFTKQGVIERS